MTCDSTVLILGETSDRAQRSCLIAYGNLEGLRPAGAPRGGSRETAVKSPLNGAGSAFTRTARRLQPDVPVGPPELSPRCEGSANPPDEEDT